MRIGLIDVDGHNFPNIPLMKISAYHKASGNTVEWYDPLIGGWYDVVYMAKVFSFTPDYEYFVNAGIVIKGGSGYAIETENGREVYQKGNATTLSPEIEHIYPDYGLYPELIKDTSYGFLTRGCPRGCQFCHVSAKEGASSYKVADLAEFWRGQKNIVLCDPNLLACKDWRGLLQQLIDSGAKVDINQGLDIRIMTDEKAEMIRRLNISNVHFAWDRYDDKDLIIPKLEAFKAITGWGYRKMGVYVLTNYDTNIEQDLERIYTLRDMGYNPFVMVYNREATKSRDTVRRLQRWVNNRVIFRTVPRFTDYEKHAEKKGANTWNDLML